MIAEKKYTLSEIMPGMKVKASQLSEILDTHIILTDVKLVKNSIGVGSFEGIIDTISEEWKPLTKPNSCLIFHDSSEQEEYDEYE